MKKSELKDLIKETIEEAQGERCNEIIREALEHDVKTLKEERELHESLIAEGVLNENELDEGFFDTLGAFGKNTFNAVAGAWKKAKAQGDEAEAKRLEKKIQKLRRNTGDTAKKAGDAGGAGAKGAGAGGDVPVIKDKKGNVLQPGDHGYTAAYAAATGQKVARRRKAAAAPEGAAEKKEVLKKSAVEILKKVKKDDPKGFQKLASMKPEEIEALAKQSPKIQQAGKKAKEEIAAQPKKGFFAKLSSWNYEHPVKAGLAVGALSALALAVAVPGVGLGALVAFGLAQTGGQLAAHTLGTSMARTLYPDKKLKKENGIPETGIPMEQWEQELEEELDNKINEINSRSRQ
jgi:hypothetical protein